ncbi:MAG: hypothetical protein HYZ71_08175 [Deltaproteobacteria bacterium]|nr:hypothetical protein [Deltaproteobacteria bacterium]
MKTLSFIALFGALVAQGSTTNCSSADGAFRYTYTRPDGGPPIGPGWMLDIDGTTVIAHSSHGGAEINTATISWSEKTKFIKKTASKNFATTYYLVDATVNSRATPEQVLFQNTVLCAAQRYIGVPRP